MINIINPAAVELSTGYTCMNYRLKNKHLMILIHIFKKISKAVLVYMYKFLKMTHLNISQL